MQQQPVPTRFRAKPSATSNIASLLTGSPDRKSSAAFSTSDHLDGIFQAVRQQVERWGEHAKWKIELVLLNQPTASSAPELPHLMNNNHIVSLHDHLAHVEGAASSPRTAATDKASFRPLKPFQREPITRSENIETWDMPYAADLRQSLKDSQDRQRYLEGVVHAQGEHIRQLKMYKKEPPMTALQILHNMTTNELKEQHHVEMKLQQKRIDILARKFKRIAATLERIERMGLQQGDAELDREQLLEERRVLVRRLHLAELRLNARDAELSYLQNILWTHRRHSGQQQQQESEEDAERMSPVSGSSSQSPYLMQKNYSPQQQTGIPTAPQPMSALDSLSILADQMLSDPDFGSEDKGSMSSPDVHEDERKRRRRAAPFRHIVDALNDARAPPTHETSSAHNLSINGISTISVGSSGPLSPIDCAQTRSADPALTNQKINREPPTIAAATASRDHTLPPMSYSRSPFLSTVISTDSSNLYTCGPASAISSNRTQQERNEVNARQSPSIAALLDSPSQQSQEPFRPSSAFRSFAPHQTGGNVSGGADTIRIRSPIAIPSPHGLIGHATSPSVMSPLPSAYHGPLSPSSTSSPQNKRKWSLELHDHHHPHSM